MSQVAQMLDEVSFRRVVGFACNQSFLLFLMYMGLNRSVPFSSGAFERVDLVASLAFMVFALVALGRMSDAHRAIVLSRPALLSSATVMALVSLCPGSWHNLAILAASAVVGACSAFLLAAWGRSFGMIDAQKAIPEVFVGSLLAAMLCLLFSLASVDQVILLMRVFPIAGAAWIDIPDASSAPSFLGGALPKGTDMLSAKVMCGTLCFGLAAGLLETYGSAPGSRAVAGCQLAMHLFGAFLIGALSLMLTDGFGKGDALNKSYRLATFVMLAGVLLVPLSAGEAGLISGQAVVLGGYLGLETVLICLFLVVARLRGTEGVVAFCSGFACLFGGEAGGVALSNVITVSLSTDATPYLVVVLAGCLALAACIFLFTERDFDSLSKVIESDNHFEDVCACLAREFGLSKREAEIVPYALGGRTSSRIAEELGISKSTVDTHLRRIYAKCGVSGRQELIDLKERR